MRSAVYPARSGMMLGLLALLMAGCDDDPFAQDWNENRTEGTVYALGHPDDVPATAWDLLFREGARLDNPDTEGDWDFAVDEEGGNMYLLPPRALGLPSRVGIHRVPDVEWEDVTRAPSDTADYVTREPVELEENDIYVFRTRQQTDELGRTCVFYGKVEPLNVDPELMRFRFSFDVNPVCNSRNLVPDDV